MEINYWKCEYRQPKIIIKDNHETYEYFCKHKNNQNKCKLNNKQDLIDDCKLLDNINNGGDTDYYRIKPEWKMAQDIIEDRKMNYAQGNIFKSAFCFNINRHDATDYLREMNKILWFCQREICKISKINNSENIDKKTVDILTPNQVNELLGESNDDFNMKEYEEYKKHRRKIEHDIAFMNKLYKLNLSLFIPSDDSDYQILENNNPIFFTKDIEKISPFLEGMNTMLLTNK